LGIAYRITGDLECARDVVQDTYVTVLNTGSAFRGYSSLKTYLYRIVINKSIDEHRRRKRWFGFVEKISNEQCDAHGALDEAMDRRKTVNDVLAKMPANLRLPLVLADVNGLSYNEIAETMDISVNCVRTRIFRCREKMRKEFLKMGWLP